MVEKAYRKKLWSVLVLDELRDRFADYLSTNRVCVISTTGHVGVWAMPARYRVLGSTAAGQALAVECLLPRWGDTLYYLDRNPKQSLIVLDYLIGSPADLEWQGKLRWVEYRGKAQAVSSPQWDAILLDDKSWGS